MKLNFENLLTAFCATIFIGGLSFAALGNPPSSVGNWVTFYTWAYDRDNPQDWSFNPASVHDRHGITVVEVKASTPKPQNTPPYVGVVAQKTIFGIDCVNGRYIEGAKEFIKADGKSTKYDVSPNVRWKPLHPANIMWDLAKKVC